MSDEHDIDEDISGPEPGWIKQQCDSLAGKMNDELREVRVRAIKEAQRANRRYLSPIEIVQIIEEADQEAGYRVVPRSHVSMPRNVYDLIANQKRLDEDAERILRDNLDGLYIDAAGGDEHERS